MAGLFDGTPLAQPVTCEICNKPLADCQCPRDGAGDVCQPRDQQARVRREKRSGKWVTVIYGLNASATNLNDLAKKLRSKCAAGGSVREDGVEIQGDHRDALVKHLKTLGYPAKPSGG